DCFVHWLYGGAYPHREQVLAEMKVTGEVLGPVHRFGHVAVSGTTCYRSGALDHGWRDNFFATYFNSGKVVRLELEPHDATFSVTQREFLSSTSHGCHLTDVAEDADGSLLVVDTGGWFYRGCPTSQFANPDIQGAIYRIRRKGMTQPVDPRGNHIDWPQQTSGQLVALLGDARFAVRERAIAECAKRGEAIAPELRQTLEHRDVGERLGAVWALTRIVGANHGTKSAAATTPSRAPGQAGPDESTAETAIRAALLDPHPSVRRAACRSIGTNPDAAALDRLLQIVQNDEPAIRREAATALGRIANAKAVHALLEGLSRDISRTEEHARIYALMEINDPAATAKGLSSPSVGVQRGALIALDQMDAGVLSPKVVTPLLDADDQSLRLAAFNVFRRRANDRRNHQASEGLVSTAQDSADSSYQDWIANAVASLDRWLVSDATIRERADVVRGLLTTFIADESVVSVVGRVLRDAKTTPETRGLLLEAIAKGNSPPLHTSWIKPLEMLLDTSDERVLDQALAAVSSIKTDHFNDKLHQIGMDESRPALVRIAAVEAGNASRTPSDAAFELLFELLAEDTPPAEKTRATQILAGLSPSTEQLVRLAESIQYAGPVELRNLVQPFVRSQEPEVARAFLDALESSQSFTVLEPHEFSDVIKGYPAELLPRANVLLDRLKELQQQKLARIDQLLPQLEAGNGARGREVFLAEKSQCSTCHRIAEEGGRVGPDLTTIGANRSGRDLLESSVFPSATIVRDFEPYTVVTTDGRVLAGLISRQTTDTLFLQQQTGDPIAIPQDDIEQIVPDVVSIMPAGLDQVLTEQQLADVIAYLMSLGRPAEGDAGGE
ncbi:MAG: HEAT repeat domain-containing protein, partial [Planctomycetes bacterium]|nr:HEAT repeat domain-containing protein [Planctomycetota bacterium]